MEALMEKIALVTDITADLMEETIKEFDIHVVPLKVSFGDEEFYANQLTGEEFYRRLAKCDELPKTSQPSPEDFRALYTKLLKDHDEIISIHISSALSGTASVANLAKKTLNGKIHVIDSKTVSLALGLMVLDAAESIKKGLNAAQIIDRLTEVRKNVEILFTLDTLEYLQKGGRIGKVHGIIGSLLKIRPVIRVGDDGICETYTKTRSRQQAINSIAQAFKKLGNGKKQIRLAIGHGAAEQEALDFKEALEDALQLKASVFTQVGPVIGTHTGPGTLGAAIQFE
jgi:DegV family protein with EDD domain